MTITLELPEAIIKKLQAEADADGRSLEAITVEHLEQVLRVSDGSTLEGYRGATVPPRWVQQLIAEKPEAQGAWQKLVGLWKDEDEEELMASLRDFRGK